MVTKVEVRSGDGSGADIHVVTGEPKELSDRVSEAINVGERFVSFAVPEDKTLSVIAERVEAIWQE